MRYFSIFLFSALLYGCISYTTPPTKSQPIPSDRFLAFQSYQPGYATMVITRDKGYFAGGGCYTAVIIDGVIAARLGVGESVSLYLPAGRHIYGITGDNQGSGLCALQIAQPRKESSSEFKPDEIQKYRISGDSSENWLDIRPSTL